MINRTLNHFMRGIGKQMAKQIAKKKGKLVYSEDVGSNPTDLIRGQVDQLVKVDQRM